MKDKTNMFAAGQAKASARQTALKESTTAKETAEPTSATAPESTEKPKAATAPVNEEVTPATTQQDTTAADQSEDAAANSLDLSAYGTVKLFGDYEIILKSGRDQTKSKKFQVGMFPEVWTAIEDMSATTHKSINDLINAATVKMLYDYQNSEENK